MVHVLLLATWWRARWHTFPSQRWIRALNRVISVFNKPLKSIMNDPVTMISELPSFASGSHPSLNAMDMQCWGHLRRKPLYTASMNLKSVLGAQAIWWSSWEEKIKAYTIRWLVISFAQCFKYSDDIITCFYCKSCNMNASRLVIYSTPFGLNLNPNENLKSALCSNCSLPPSHDEQIKEKPTGKSSNVILKGKP